jgi:superfamily II DNA or RNA helicase
MKGKFAVTLTTHRILGPLFNPVILIRSENREFYSIADRLSLANLPQYEASLFPEQVSLVKVIEEYSDHQLLRVFSKRKISAQDFLASIDETIFEMQIRPYIERRLIRCIDLLSGSEVPLYTKKMHNNIYETDRIWLQDETANAVFNFMRSAEGLKYSLTLSHGNEMMELTGKQGFILTNEPCSMVLGNRLFLLDDIDGKKLLPFFKKRSINIRKETERKFLETFARPVIQKYQVHAHGFSIIDQQVKPQPILSLETDLKGSPVLLLSFRYDDKAVYNAGKKSELLVTMEENNGEITFRRLLRNISYENHIISSLLETGLANTGNSSFVPLRIKKTEHILLVYDLVTWLNQNVSALELLGIEVSQSLPGNQYYLQQVDLKVKVAENTNDWFDIFATVYFKGFEFPFIRLKNHIVSGRREYELPDGRIAVLPEEWFARFKDMFTFARDEQDQLMIEKQHFSLLKESIQGLDGSFSGRLKKWFEHNIYEEHPVPAEIKADLRDYQQKGFTWMLNLYANEFGGCLADDMGLGKTLQTLVLLQQVLKNENERIYGPASSVFERQLTIFNGPAAARRKAKPALVVVPTSLVHNWINEVTRFAPGLRAASYTGQNRKDFRTYYDACDLIITTYGLIRNDLEQIRIYDFLYIILDESQLIKNPHSKTYKAVISLTAAHRLVLTGTPIENSLTDLWAQMNFLNPGLLGNYQFFNTHFVTPIEKSRNGKQMQTLRTLIRPFVLRRTKDEVALELPELTEQVVYCEMSDSQQLFYDTEKSKVRNLIFENIRDQGIEKSSFIILQSLTKLRQAANHPVILDPKYTEDSGKYDAVIDKIENLIAEGHKALIFSSFVQHLDLYTSYCKLHSISYSLLTGNIPQYQRESIIERFESTRDIPLFFISIKAGGFGLNLTAADYVFIIDPWWNPAVEAQAKSRAHRLGQEKHVFVYRFITRDTIEEKIHLLQDRKSNLAASFVNSNNPFSTTDVEEILNLFV